MSSITTTISSTLSSVVTALSPTLLAHFQYTYLWVVIVGFILAFFVGFGMGAIDVANTFGTSIGSKVLTHKQAYMLASLLIVAGAVLVGKNVTDTLREKIIDVDLYKNAPQELLVGQVAILGAVSFWLIIASLGSVPVASTHSIVGALIGFSVFMKGWQGVHWSMVVEIVIAWIISPILGGITSSTLYMIVDFAILRRKEPLKCGLRMLPVFYFFVVAFLTFTITFQGLVVFGVSHVPVLLCIAISIVCGLIASVLVQLVEPWLIKWIKNKENLQFNLSTVEDVNMNKIPISNIPRIPYYTQPKFEMNAKGIIKWFFPAKEREEDKETIQMFSALQVFTACFGAFAFGANDISHVISSITVITSIYHSMNVDQNEPTPLYIYLYGSLAISVGLWCLGHKVIKTIGKKMTIINPCSGFTIEFGMALITLMASKVGIPVSTTQCMVGSVVGVGLVKSGEGIKWKIILYTVISWVVTLPSSGLLTVAIMFVLKHFFLK